MVTSQPPNEIVESIRKALSTYRAESGLTEMALAPLVGMSVSGFNDFMSGRRGLGPATWRALYRTRPELRWLLEEYQRSAALSSDQEAGPVAAAPRR